MNETLQDLGENGLVRRIARWANDNAHADIAPPGAWADIKTMAGIGDDTALVRPAPGAPPMALTTDMLVEGVHFLPDHPPEALGAKAAAASLSDLAATGAWPAWMLVSLGAPGATPVAWVEAFYRGLRQAGSPYGCRCIGGDCVRAEKLTINIVAGGNCHPDAALPQRDRAQPGQSLYVTGALGDSAAGLELLRNATSAEEKKENKKDFDYLRARHQRPEARVHAGLAIARHCPDAAMMDLSDGLDADARRLATASAVGFEIHLAALPISPALQRRAKHLPRSAISYALFGGEDYELLFATASSLDTWRDQVAIPLTHVGAVTSLAGEIRYLDRAGKDIRPDGASFQHY